MINLATNSFVNDHAKCIAFGPTKKAKPSLTGLPNVIQNLIISYLTPQEVACIISRVCKNINRMQNQYWRDQFSNNFGKENSTDMLWKERFRQASQIFKSVLEKENEIYFISGRQEGPTIKVTINDKKLTIPSNFISRMFFNLYFDGKSLDFKTKDQLKINDIHIVMVLDQITYKIPKMLWEARIRIRFGIPMILLRSQKNAPWEMKQSARRSWYMIPEEKSNVIEKLITIEKRINSKLNAMVKEATAHNLQILNNIKNTDVFLPFDDGKRFYCDSLGKLKKFEEESKAQVERVVRYYGHTDKYFGASFIQWSNDDRSTPYNMPEPISLESFAVGQKSLKKRLEAIFFVSVLSKTAQLVSQRLGSNVANIEEIDVDLETELTQNQTSNFPFHAPIALYETFLRKYNIWKSPEKDTAAKTSKNPL